MSLSRTYYVYLLTNWNNKVMYVGVTGNLERRLYEHKQKLVVGFTQKYNLNKLVYFEETNDVRAALEREKEMQQKGGPELKILAFLSKPPPTKVGFKSVPWARGVG